MFHYSYNQVEQLKNEIVTKSESLTDTEEKVNKVVCQVFICMCVWCYYIGNTVKTRNRSY